MSCIGLDHPSEITSYSMQFCLSLICVHTASTGTCTTPLSIKWGKGEKNPQKGKSSCDSMEWWCLVWDIERNLLPVVLYLNMDLPWGCLHTTRRKRVASLPSSDVLLTGELPALPSPSNQACRLDLAFAFHFSCKGGWNSWIPKAFYLYLSSLFTGNPILNARDRSGKIVFSIHLDSAQSWL